MDRIFLCIRFGTVIIRCGDQFDCVEYVCWWSNTFLTTYEYICWPYDKIMPILLKSNSSQSFHSRIRSGMRTNPVNDVEFQSTIFLEMHRNRLPAITHKRTASTLNDDDHQHPHHITSISEQLWYKFPNIVRSRVRDRSHDHRTHSNNNEHTRNHQRISYDNCDS